MGRRDGTASHRGAETAKETQITERMPLNRRGRGGRKGNRQSEGHPLLPLTRQGRRNASGVSPDLQVLR
jgi:hypothetical protein